MIDIRGPYRIGAIFIAISAVQHVLAFVVAGFSAIAMQLIPVGIVYLILAYGLLRGWRWMAYITFVVALIGSIVALGSVWSIGPVPGWWWALIVIADVAAVLGLFAALWRPAPSTS